MPQKLGTVQPGSSQFSLDSAQVRHDHCCERDVWDAHMGSVLPTTATAVPSYYNEGQSSSHKAAARQLQGLAVFCIMIYQSICRRCAAALKLSIVYN